MRCWKVIESIRCELAQNQIIRRQVETSNNAARDAHAQLSFMVRDITMLAKSVHGFKHHTVDNAFGMTDGSYRPLLSSEERSKAAHL